jgi:Ca2+-binding RTX toxin-like protein
MPSPPRTSTLLLTAALALAAGAATTGVADAATLARTPEGALVYAGGPASTKLDVQAGDGTQVVFYGSSLDAVTSYPADCAAQYDASVITCAQPPEVRVDMGDGDDHGQVSADVHLPVALAGGAGNDWLEGNGGADRLDGGPGDDKLVGSTGDDALLGGDGNDELQGGAGNDRLDGGAGDDLLRPDGFEDPGHDVVDGGPGTDRVEQDYVSRFTETHPLLDVTLAGGADDGRPGEGDDLRSVEAVTLGIGGRFTGTDGPDEIVLRQVGSANTLSGAGGDDHLRGGDGADELDGGPGADVLDGGYGDDRIVGGPGRDAIHADQSGADCGPVYCKLPYGNDVVDARDGDVDTIDCGFGADRVVADAADVVAADCETVDRGTAQAVAPQTGPASAPRPGTGARMRLSVVGSHRLASVLRHGLRVRISGATGRVTVRALLGGRRVAGATGRATVTLRPGPTARRRLRAARRPKLSVVAGKTRITVRLTGAAR